MKVKFIGDPLSMTAGTAKYMREVLDIVDGCGHDVVVQGRDIYRDQKLPVGGRLGEMMAGGHGEADVAVHVMMPEHYTPDSKSRCNVGLFFYEAFPLPGHLMDKIKGVDGVVAPSKFCEVVFRHAVSAPVEVVLFAKVDAVGNGGDPYLQILGQGDRDRYIFFSAFQWSYRKGWDLLLRAYWSVFSPGERVALVIKSYLNFDDRSPEVIRQQILALKASCSLVKANGEELPTPPVFLVNGYLGEGEMVDMYRNCDCFVLPTRGEGFSKNVLEAAVYGKPGVKIVTTSVAADSYLSGIDFIDYNSVPCFGMESSFMQDGTFTPNFPPSSLMVEPVMCNSYNGLCDLMRSAYDGDGSVCLSPRADVGLFSKDFASSQFYSFLERVCSGTSR